MKRIADQIDRSFLDPIGVEDVAVRIENRCGRSGSGGRYWTARPQAKSIRSRILTTSRCEPSLADLKPSRPTRLHSHSQPESLRAWRRRPWNLADRHPQPTAGKTDNPQTPPLSWARRLFRSIGRSGSRCANEAGARGRGNDRPPSAVRTSRRILPGGRAADWSAPGLRECRRSADRLLRDCAVSPRDTAAQSSCRWCDFPEPSACGPRRR